MTDDRTRRPQDAAGRLAELRRGRSGEEIPEPLLPEAEEVSEEAFSTLSADRQQKVMLEFRYKSGDAEALSYSYLTRAYFNPSKGIRLVFVEGGARIEGRNLRPVFAAIVAQRAAFVQEQDDLYAEGSAAADTPVVTRIEVSGKSEG